PSAVRLEDVVQLSVAVAATPARLGKIALLAALFGRLRPEEAPIAIGFLVGWPRQGKLGVGWATVASAHQQPSAAESTLTLDDLDRAFDAIAAARRGER